MGKLSIRDLDLKGKRVLLRVDFNVPLDEKLNITDDKRIKAALPTIKYLLEKRAGKIILLSHLGRPEGRIVESLRLDPVARRLESLLGEKVKKLNDCIGEEVKRTLENCSEKLVLLENLRFHIDEKKNHPGFAKELASLGDLFINDAFGSAHRAHASTEGITHYLISSAGFLMEKEIKYLGEVLGNPRMPFIVVLGGAKVSDKINVIENLLPRSEAILIGGAMAYTFLKAKGIDTGNSKLEKEKVGLAREILEKALCLKKKIVLPLDHIIADKIALDARIKQTEDADITSGWLGVDIGPKTREAFKTMLKEAKTVLWNGPLGIFEMKPFSQGTKEIALCLAELKADTVVGGGDTAAAVSMFGVEDKVSHVSTGGGAALEYMEGKVLPGIAALSDKKSVSIQH